MSKDLGRPSTPANLVRNPNGSIAGLNNLNLLINNAKPNRPSRNLPGESIYSQLKSPLSPPSNINPQNLGLDPASPANDDDDIEMAINRLLIVIDKNEPVDYKQLKQTLQKCLLTMSHYKLQNQILKFNSNETLKRSEIENELIQKQVDQLSNFLKSPFVPKEEIGQSIENDLYTIKKDFPKKSLSFNKKLRLGKVNKPSKLKLKLVEKHPNVSNSSNISITNNDNIKNNTEFNQCIKVFHLEKN